MIQYLYNKFNRMLNHTLSDFSSRLVQDQPEMVLVVWYVSDMI